MRYNYDYNLFRAYFAHEAATTNSATATDFSLTIQRGGYTAQMTVCVIADWCYLDYRFGGSDGETLEGGVVPIDVRMKRLDNRNAIKIAATELTKLNKKAGSPLAFDLVTGFGSTVIGSVRAVPYVENPTPIVPAGSQPDDDPVSVLTANRFYISVGLSYPIKI